MHITIISPTFFPIRGGTEQTIYEWVKRLKKNHKISILTLNYPKAPRRELFEESIDIYRIPPWEIRIIGHIIRAMLIVITLMEINRKAPIDVLHMGHVFRMGLGVTIFRKLSKIPYIISLLGCDTYDPIVPIAPCYYPYMGYVMTHADQVITMTHHMKKSAEEQGCRKSITLIPHGSTMRDKKGVISLREKHQIGAEKRIVVSIQRLAARKGMHYLIQAIPAVIDKMDDVHFIIGGTGEEEQMLHEKARELEVDQYITWTGFIPDEELPSYYEQADLFALPTLYEGFGIVYVDALSKGVPIVTTAQGGALDIITDEVGILVPLADSQAMGDAIIDALGKEWSKETIIEYAKKYNWDPIVEQYETIYRTVIKPKKMKRILKKHLTANKYLNGSKRGQVTRLTGGTQAQMKEDDIEHRFREIYLDHSWSGVSRSGPGSEPQKAAIYLNTLQGLIREPDRAIHSVVDIGCGDWSLSKGIEWENISYTGIDIVPELIEDLNERYGSDRIRFVHANIVKNDLPVGDLAIVKDVLQHLSNESVLAFLKKLPKYRFVLITNDCRRYRRMRWPFCWIKLHQRPNVDTYDGGSRPLRLNERPFFLPATELASWDMQLGQSSYTKQTLLWERSEKLKKNL